MTQVCTPGRGKGIAWLREHVDYEGNECLIWPFFKDPKRGYGVLGHEGKLFKAHRLMCAMVNGPTPSPLHEAAHSCGRGPQGCCTPKHLSWKTRTENQRDRRAHGTVGNGGMGRRRRLTPEQVMAIRASSGTVTELSERFGVTRSAIRKIQTGEIWQSMFGSPEQDRIAKVVAAAAQPVSMKSILDNPALSDIAGRGNMVRKLARKGFLNRVGRGFYSASPLVQSAFA